LTSREYEPFSSSRGPQSTASTGSEFQDLRGLAASAYTLMVFGLQNLDGGFTMIVDMILCETCARSTCATRSAGAEFRGRAFRPQPRD
jgi:hypothetical protein